VNEVINFIQEVAQPFTTEEEASIKEMVTMGSEMFTQAQKKVDRVSKVVDQVMLQTQESGSLFATKPDGSIDTDAAVNQMTNLVSQLASPSNPLDKDEKDALHGFISQFAKILVPSKETTEGMGRDLEQLMGHFSKQVENVDNQLNSVSKIDTANLMGLITDGQKFDETKFIKDVTSIKSDVENIVKSFDLKGINDLTAKFMDRVDNHLSEATAEQSK